MPSLPSQAADVSMPPAVAKPAGAFRVIHTADWHLGKAMGDLDRTEEHRRFLGWLLETILATETDALVIAGDVFDCATPPQSAIRLYFDFLAALHRRSHCQVVVTAGNHDSPSHLEAPRDLLRVINVTVSATPPLGVPDQDKTPAFDAAALLVPLPSAEQPQLVVAAAPFFRERDLRTGQLGQTAAEIQRDIQNGLRERYAEIAAAAQPWLERGIPVLATGHLTALGATTSTSEREIHVGGLGSIGAEAFPAAFAYVALGHLHRPQAVGGVAHIRYSGSPLALSFGEATDAKEIRLLDFLGGALAANQALPIPQARQLIQLRVPYPELSARLREFEPPAGTLPAWVELSVHGATDGEDLHKTVQEAVAGRPFSVVRVTLERAGQEAALGLQEDAAEEEADHLLADPKAVFRHRLEQEPFADAEREPLITAFDELCALLEDRRRMGALSA